MSGKRPLMERLVHPDRRKDREERVDEALSCCRAEPAPSEGKRLDLDVVVGHELG